MDDAFDNSVAFVVTHTSSKLARSASKQFQNIARNYTTCDAWLFNTDQLST